jgi:hypothetical protein
LEAGSPGLGSGLGPQARSATLIAITKQVRERAVCGGTCVGVDMESGAVGQGGGERSGVEDPT